MNKKIKVTRSYTLKLYGTKSKFENLKWSAYQYSKLTNSFINHLYFNNMKFYSTIGLGVLGNNAQKKALGIVKSKIRNEKENFQKMKIPVFNKVSCYAQIQQIPQKNFDYLIKFSVGFHGVKNSSCYLFAKQTKPLKNALKSNWIISNQCELYLNPKNNHWYVVVFASKKVKKAIPKDKSIGIDVGIRQIITTSDKYLGKSISKRLKKLNNSKKEKSRQFSLAKNRNDINLVEKLSKNLTKNKNINKTIIKQLLDKEAKKVIARGLSTSSNLVVEDPKVLANLTGNKGLVRWARTYFAYRLQVLGKERSVFVVFTNPAYTSITCSKCGDKDKENRDKLKFHCLKCGHRDHADINAAVNLSLKGQEHVDKNIKPKFENIYYPQIRALNSFLKENS